jgi:hypothetical protein
MKKNKEEKIKKEEKEKKMFFINESKTVTRRGHL